MPHSADCNHYSRHAPAAEHQHGDEGEGDGGLPDLHPVRGVDHEDDQQPHVGEHGEDHRDAEHRERLDLPRLSVRNHHHAASKQTVRERQGSKDVLAKSPFSDIY